MNKDELKNKIQSLIPNIIEKIKIGENSATEFEELIKFPKLKEKIIDLLTNEYGSFIETIDWVAPKPTTFRINLLNGQYFYLIYNTRSWIAEVSGKKYYLLNLPEQELAIQAINVLLRLGSKTKGTSEKDDLEIPSEEPASEPEETPAET